MQRPHNGWLYLLERSSFYIDESVQTALVGTMTYISSVSSKSVEAVFSFHNIKHLFPHEVRVALYDFLRVLKFDDFVVIICPDLQAVCAFFSEHILSGPAYTSHAGPITSLDILYSRRPAMARGNLYMEYKCRFKAKIL